MGRCMQLDPAGVHRAVIAGVRPCRQAGEGPCLRAVKLRRVQRPQPAAELATLCKCVRRRIRRRALQQCRARSCTQAHACVACGALLHPRHDTHGMVRCPMTISPLSAWGSVAPGGVAQLSPVMHVASALATHMALITVIQG